MIKKNQRLLNELNMLLDLAAIFLSYPLAVFVRFDILNGQRNLEPLARGYLLVAAVYSLLIVVVYAACRMYGSARFKRPGEEILAVAFINGVGTVALMAALYVTRIVDFSRLTMVFFWLISSLLVSLKRITVKLLLQHYRARGYNQKHVIVVGNGHLAHQYIRDVSDHPQMGFTVDGYVSAHERPELGVCLGSYEDIGLILGGGGVDEVVVALEPHEVGFMKAVLAAADKEGLRVSIIPFYNDYIPPHPTIDVMGETKLINLRATPLDNVGWVFIKRLMDVVCSLILIVLTSPLMLVTAVGVKLSSPGPILFRQERIGRNKKPFSMLKFRSMRVTDTADTAWSTDADPRKTRFGAFIRKYSIDELPQFFNVLRGDMSLVGPRPEIPYHVNHFKEEIPLYLVRQQVRPGITGWAQVNGLRGDTSIVERVRYDIWYIENWSIALDIKILLKTVFGGMVNSETVTTADAEK